MRIACQIASLTSLFAAGVASAGELRWQTTIEGTGSQLLEDLSEAEDGSLYTVGLDAGLQAGAVLVARLQSDGNQIWARRYSLSGLQERGLRVIPFGNDGCLVIASLNRSGSPDFRPWLLRLDADGELLWSTEDGLSNQLSVDSAITLGARLDAERIVLAGGSNSFSDVQDPWLAIVDNHGQLLQFRSFLPLGGPGFGVQTYVNDMLVSDGDIILVGSASYTPGQAYFWRFSDQLEPLAAQRYQGLDLREAKDIVAAGEDFLLLGPSFNSGAASLLRVNAQGEIQQQLSLPVAEGYTDAAGLALTADGRVQLLRQRFPAFGSRAIQTELVTLASDWSVLSIQPLPGGEIASVPWALTIAADGDLLATGYRRQANDAEELDGLVLRLGDAHDPIFASDFDGG